MILLSYAICLVDRLGFSSNQSKVDFDDIFEALELWRKVLEP